MAQSKVSKTERTKAVKTIKELTGILNRELKKLHLEFNWGEYANCECAGKILYGSHINLYLYYEDDNKPVKATHLLRQQTTNLFKKYYSSSAKFYKANHSQDGSYAPARRMLNIVILI